LQQFHERGGQLPPLEEGRDSHTPDNVKAGECGGLMRHATMLVDAYIGCLAERVGSGNQQAQQQQQHSGRQRQKGEASSTEEDLEQAVMRALVSRCGAVLWYMHACSVCPACSHFP